MGFYLTEEQLRASLGLGRAVEQWLGHVREQDYVTLKWLRIDKEKNESFTVAYFESFDEGNKDFLDIYEFPLLDPDEPYGILNIFESADLALEFSRLKYEAKDSKYVSAGMIQEEYRKYLDTKG